MKRTKNTTVLSLKDLCIWRGRTEILRGISWTIQRGEHWVILGGNGSGKTSLLSGLLGYLTISSGDIELLGERYGESDWTALRRKIGIVSSAVRQMMADPEPAIYSVASGKYAMIDFWGEPSRADLAEARKIMRTVECEHLSERPWAVLSQGERQRILIGRALMARPAVMILDEPCAGLDPVARDHFLQFVDRLGSRSDAPTMILVTHHVEEIRPVFTHALLLRQGKMVACGLKKKVLTSRNLSETFGSPVRLKSAREGYSLRIG